jgi:hypothetical protein
VYDWWDLASAWGLPNAKPAINTGERAGGSASEAEQEDGERGPHPQWARELMEEAGVRALPQNVELLGRAMGSRDFWRTFGSSPLKARLD